MATKLLKIQVPLDVIYKDGLFLLIDIQRFFEYENGKKTERLAGYKYIVADTVDFDKIKIKIKGQTIPLIAPEELAERRKNGEKIFVEFIGGYDKLYNRNFNGQWTVEDSFSAEDVRLVDTENEI